MFNIFLWRPRNSGFHQRPIDKIWITNVKRIDTFIRLWLFYRRLYRYYRSAQLNLSFLFAPFFFSTIFMMILFFILRTTLAIHEYVHTRIGDVHCCCCCCNCTHTHNALHWINIFAAVFRFSFFLSFSYFGWLCVIKKSRMRVFASPIDVSPREWMNGAPIIRNLQMTVLNYEAIDVQLHIYIDLLIYIKLCGQLMGC